MMGPLQTRVGRLEAIVIDVGDLERAEKFWSSITGYTFGPSFEPQFRRATVLPGSGVSLVLQKVTETKVLKNRVHLDIEASNPEQALKQVVAIGGRLVSRAYNQAGVSFIVCADPDGNEFCLVPPI